MPVDELSQDFLRVLIEYGGEADTSTIREETGMTRGQVGHRFTKLEDKNWIEIDRAEQGKGDRTPPKIAILTEEGDTAIRKGEAGEKVLGKDEDTEEIVELTREEFENFKTDFEGLKNQLNLVVDEIEPTEGKQSDNVTEKLNNIENDISRLMESFNMLNETVSDNRDRVKDIEENINLINKNNNKDNNNINIDGKETIEELNKELDYVKSWMPVAERHLKALKLLMNDRDIDFESYLDKASEE